MQLQFIAVLKDMASVNHDTQTHLNSVSVCQSSAGTVLRWGRVSGEHVPPDSLVALPQIPKLADRSDVIS